MYHLHYNTFFISSVLRKYIYTYVCIYENIPIHLMFTVLHAYYILKHITCFHLMVRSLFNRLFTAILLVFHSETYVNVLNVLKRIKLCDWWNSNIYKFHKYLLNSCWMIILIHVCCCVYFASSLFWFPQKYCLF